MFLTIQNFVISKLNWKSHYKFFNFRFALHIFTFKLNFLCGTRGVYPVSGGLSLPILHPTLILFAVVIRVRRWRWFLCVAMGEVQKSSIEFKDIFRVLVWVVRQVSRRVELPQHEIITDYDEMSWIIFMILQEVPQNRSYYSAI